MTDPGQPGWPSSVKLADLTSYITDAQRGRLLELWDGAVQAMVDVRTQVKEAQLRPLLIVELQRAGYVVLEPGHGGWASRTPAEVLEDVAVHYDHEPDELVPGWQVARKLRAVAESLAAPDPGERRPRF